MDIGSLSGMPTGAFFSFDGQTPLDNWAQELNQKILSEKSQEAEVEANKKGSNIMMLKLGHFV